MTLVSASALPNLIGISVAESRCFLSAKQILQLGTLLLRLRPHDAQAVCFLGGSLSDLPAEGDANVVRLGDIIGEAPFLVLAGQHGALALLTAPTTEGYCTHLLSEPDVVDRAALVLAQFSDSAYSLETVCDPESQRAFLAHVIAALFEDVTFKTLDLLALLPKDQRWVTLVKLLLNQPESATCLSLPEVQSFLREGGISRALLGKLAENQQKLEILAATGGAAPEFLAVVGEFDLAPLLTNVIRSRRPGVASPTAKFKPGPDGGSKWANKQALTIIPLLFKGELWGMLLTASDRPISGSARANLNGLGVLLALILNATSEADLVASAFESHPPLRSAMSQPLPVARPNPAKSPQAAPSPAGGTSGQPGQMPKKATWVNRLSQGIYGGAGKASSPAGMDLMPLLEQLHEGVLLTDAQGRLVASTKAAEKMLGLSQDSLGQSLAESGAWFLAPLLTDAVIGEFEGYQEVMLPSGRLVLVTVVGLDQGLWAFIARPEPEAEVDLHDHDLEKASSASAANTGHSSNFIISFSNSIRSPLLALRNLIIKVPAAGALNEQQSGLIGQVVKLNSELTMLINDLLTLGQLRLETTQNSKPLRLDHLVEAAIGTRYAEFGRRGQQVETEIDPNLPRAFGSEEGLGRAVGELLDNAIQYSPPGAHINVSLKFENGEIEVIIADTGVGLTTDELEQVFDPFYRGVSAEQLGVAGRGLGLTIAKTVVEHHGGRIWVASEVGKGSTFTFTLPCEPEI